MLTVTKDGVPQTGWRKYYYGVPAAVCGIIWLMIVLFFLTAPLWGPALLVLLAVR